LKRTVDVVLCHVATDGNDEMVLRSNLGPVATISDGTGSHLLAIAAEYRHLELTKTAVEHKLTVGSRKRYKTDGLADNEYDGYQAKEACLYKGIQHRDLFAP
jgi:hypothetical protein